MTNYDRWKLATPQDPDLILESVPSAFFITDVKNHPEIKKRVLDAINSMEVHCSVGLDLRVCNTDWGLNTNFCRSYWDIVKPHCEEHLFKIHEYLGSRSNFAILNYWFQQYAKGDFHGWHGHADATFSSVYFVDLPSKELSTSFKFSSVEFQINVGEGQIITFPSCYLHRSNPNPTSNVKTVIAFNSNLLD
jgi:hypothetical protein